MFGHELENLGRAGVAVFDGLHSGERRAAHAFRRGGMDCHGDSGAARGFHSELQLVEGEGRTRTGPGSPTVVAVEFDPVGAVADLVAHDAGEAVDTIRLLSALRNVRSE